ncbi:N-acetylmuramoyl-L-alanine amidase [Solidesulfovibrio magneticus]|uniref:N-acetylmuramoyl-L-alanine amidase n=1 Tax=Solidesulfovibrio magneticus (strain ATCC 700980 / DSM 13731 / RS-1) TaxID=573370 RepID=C4XSE3_SOLM1|nr:N-acetylmuramoyl-L-alanine amidase [Solidesulfovibrio magneticus]BAH75665.1 N-acetylmuramoyl-L-alanine amidase family protein [Solidesulfovibrio magneticus RS-1]
MMDRRRVLSFLAVAGGLAWLRPSALFAASADELAGEGQAELTGGNVAKALVLLHEAESKDPRNDRVQALLGRAYFQQGDARTALTHFTRAVRLNPEDTLSRLLADTISQFPMPAAKVGSGREPSPSRSRPSRLAQDAKAEREALAKGAGKSTRQGPWRVLLDAGHGGLDAGAAVGGLREADVTLDLALRLARALAPARNEVIIHLTRTADVSLPGWARAGLAGFYGADLLVSLHAARVSDPAAMGIAAYGYGREPSDAQAALVARVENAAYGPGASWKSRGGEGLFLAAANNAVGQDRFARGLELARAFMRAMPAAAPLPTRVAGSAPLKLLEEADAPALLLETGFLSNADDAAALGSPDKRQALAQALADAFLAALRGVKMPPAAGRG